MNKWVNRAIIVFQYIYESRIAPFFAEYIWFFWWPLYIFLKNKNFCFVINIAEGTGQVLPELDNFFLMLKSGEINQKKKYVWLRTRNDFSKALLPLYGKKFHYARMSNILYDLLLPLILRFRDITHDAGMAGLHWQLPDKGIWKYPAPWQTFLYMDPKNEILSRWRNWYKRRRGYADYAPLAEVNFSPSEALKKFLGEDRLNIVLIHIKTNVMNATASVTDPATYLPAIKYLQQKRYRLVFVGREEMPKEFHGKNILNYSQSSVASFLHDLQLFSLAKFSITGGSGIAWIADCLRKPVLYLNSWHIGMPPATETCIFVPALVRKKADNTLLYFQEQYELYANTSAEHGDRFPFSAYTPINATAEDILEGLHELELVLEGSVQESDHQKKFKHSMQNTWMKYAQSRISNAFLEKYKNLL